MYADSILSLSIITILLAILAFVVMVYFSEYIAKGIDTKISNATINYILKISGIVLSLKIIQNIGWGIYQSNNNYGKYNLLSSFQIILVNFGIVIISYKVKNNLTVLMQWIAFVHLIIILIQIIELKQYVTHIGKGKLNYKLIKEQSYYAWTCWGSNIGAIAFTHGDKLIVGNILGASTLAIYSTFTSITSYISTIASQIIHPVFPELSKLNYLNKNIEKIKNTIKNSIFTNATIAVFIAVMLILVSEILLKLLLRENYNDDLLKSFYLLIVIYAINSLNAPGYYALLSLNKNSIVMAVVLIFGLLSLGLVYWGASVAKMYGAVYGNVGYSFTVILVYLALKKYKFDTLIWLQILCVPLLSLFFVYFYKTRAISDPSIETIVLELIVVVTGYTTLSWFSMGITAPDLKLYIRSKFI